MAQSKTWRNRRRGPYKLYDSDPSHPVPKSTKAKWKNKHSFVDHDDDINELLHGDDMLNPDANIRQDDDINELLHGDDMLKPDANIRQDDDNNELLHGDELLYPGADITKAQSILLHMAFLMKHNLTKAAIQDYLTTLNTLYPSLAPTTKYLFLKEFDMQKVPQLHFYCENCYGPISDENIPQCSFCNHTFVKKSAYDNGKYFITFDLMSQMIEILEKHPIEISSDPEYIADICDGYLYKTKVKDNDISLTFSCDGLSIFRTSSFQIWPVQYTINELPPGVRFKATIIGGLWFGEKKPIFNTFFPPMVDMLNTLSEDGIKYFDKDIGIYVKRKVKTLLACCDAPARAAVKNVSQFNGYFGCDFCLHPGVSVAKGRGHVVRFPFSSPEPDKRTHDSHIQHVVEAESTGRSVKGVKGPSYLNLVSDFDISKGFVVDYMHACLLGVARCVVMDLWLDTSNHGNQWYINDRIQQIDSLLLGIRRPHEITRTPRSLTMAKFWKASEWRSFTLFYSIPVLKGILPDKYLNHWTLFVAALHILLQRRIDYANLYIADAALKKFVIYMRLIYGLQHVSYNIHLLTHLVDCVRHCGPLWATSAFPFEGAFVKFKKLFNGTQGIPQQICTNYLQWLDLKGKLDAYSTENASATFLSLTDKLVGPSTSHILKARRYSEGIVALGSGKSSCLRPEVNVLIEATFGFQCSETSKATTYTRFVFEGSLVQSKTMGAKKRCDSYFQMKSGHFCEIECLLCICRNNCYVKCDCENLIVAIIAYSLETNKAIENIDPDINICCNFLYTFKAKQQMALSEHDLWRKAVFIKVKDTEYLSPLPNPFERD